MEHKYILVVLSGLAGILLHYLKRKISPQDEELGAVLNYFKKHAVSSIASLLVYFLWCIVLWEMGELNYFSAISSGYMVDSIAAGFKLKQ